MWKKGLKPGAKYFHAEAARVWLLYKLVLAVMHISSEHWAPAARGELRDGAVLPGWLWPCRPSYPAHIALGKLIADVFSLVLASPQWSGRKVSPEFKKKQNIAKTKNLLGVADLFVDKLNTDMQTAGTSKALGNQQLQRMQLFLLSSKKEKWDRQFGTRKAGKACRM